MERGANMEREANVERRRVEERRSGAGPLVEGSHDEPGPVSVT